jgi:hypothetical protein
MHQALFVQVGQGSKEAAGPAGHVTREGRSGAGRFREVRPEGQFFDQERTPGKRRPGRHNALRDEFDDGRMVQCRQDCGFVIGPLEILFGVTHSHLDGYVRTALTINGAEDFGQRTATQPFLEFVVPGHGLPGQERGWFPDNRCRVGAHADRAGAALKPASSWKPPPQRHTGVARTSGEPGSVKVTNALTTPSAGFRELVVSIHITSPSS